MQKEEISEEQLDLFKIPHPAMGDLTMREMLYFFAYPIRHHHNGIRKPA